MESVPFGESIMDYAEAQRWDEVPMSDLPKKGVDVAKTAYRYVEGAANRTLGNASSSPAITSATDSIKETTKATTQQAKKAVSSGVTYVQKQAEPAKAKVQEVVDATKSKAAEVSDDLKDLVQQAEKALKGEATEAPKAVATSKPVAPSQGVDYNAAANAPSTTAPSDKSVYDAALPLGFEPPPGYTRPSAPKPVKKDTTTTPSLPLVAPAVKDLSASEPVIAQIASSIDGLATLLKDSPASSTGAKDILDAAQIDLVKLGGRIDAIKKEEQAKLEAQLDEQAKDYSLKMLQLEVNSQDKMDAQEEGFKAMLEDERNAILNLYRQKLAAELETQSEIINQR